MVLTRMARPGLLKLMRGMFKGFSMERLMLTGQGRDVEITLRSVPKSLKIGGIRFKREAA